MRSNTKPLHDNGNKRLPVFVLQLWKLIYAEDMDISQNEYSIVIYDHRVRLAPEVVEIFGLTSGRIYHSRENRQFL